MSVNDEQDGGARIIPKAFVSYSWTSPTHQELIRGYADRLLADGIDVVIDQYDLSEGQDKYKFMEKMVTDPTVSHVLAFCDRTHAAKADARRAGVGTESQIISREVYEKVEQTKFIPIACEICEDGEFSVPQFLKSRITLDFSTAEKVNESWEKLVRLLHGKPALVKPAVGLAPAYIDETAIPSSPSVGKLASYKAAVLNGRPGLGLHRQDFLGSIFDYANSLKSPMQNDDEIITRLHNMLPIRDQFVDWLIMEEAVAFGEGALVEVLLPFFERLISFRFRRSDTNPWVDKWSDSHRILSYEIFLYAIAILLEKGRFGVVSEVLHASFVLPDEVYRNDPLMNYEGFYVYSNALSEGNERLKLRRISPVADLIKERATRSDVPFRSIMQADAVLFLNAIIHNNARWYPQTLVFAEHGVGVRFPLLIRAKQKRFFEKFRQIFGNGAPQELKGSVITAMKERHSAYRFDFVDLDELIDAESWQTVD